MNYNLFSKLKKKVPVKIKLGDVSKYINKICKSKYIHEVYTFFWSYKWIQNYLPLLMLFSNLDGINLPLWNSLL